MNYPNCYRCGRRHRASVCRHKETVCGKKGHIARACRNKDEDPKPEQNQPQPSEQGDQPTNVSELRVFLGLVNYYRKFMQNLSTLLAPLYALLLKKVPWEWREEQQEVFGRTKALLKSPKLLAHYDREKNLLYTRITSR